MHEPRAMQSHYREGIFIGREGIFVKKSSDLLVLSVLVICYIGPDFKLYGTVWWSRGFETRNANGCSELFFHARHHFLAQGLNISRLISEDKLHIS